MGFEQAEKLKEKKDFIPEFGQDGPQMEVVDYFREIGGTRVAEWVAIDRVQYRILEATCGYKVIWPDKDNKNVLEDIDIVKESMNPFPYIERPLDGRKDSPKRSHDITANTSVIIPSLPGGK
ncbi:putative portal protein [Staphylococcus phage vB_SauH_DELF3]|nr:putative portal protein [Staphylococcus phage vB_SauH_DELF3]